SKERESPIPLNSELSSDRRARLSDGGRWIVSKLAKQPLDLCTGDRIDVDVHLSGIFKKFRVVHGTHKRGPQGFHNARRHIRRSGDRPAQENLLEMELQDPALLVG